MRNPIIMKGKRKSKVIPVIKPGKQLKAALQQAIELEVATIPIYLYTYYSINRTPAPPKGSRYKTLESWIESDLPKKMAVKRKKALAKKLALELEVFANKAGALIMSVAVEEMLHMALSSNVKQALFGPPQLANVTPIFPTALPGHVPPFPINLAPFSSDQLLTFLKIESPDHFSEVDTGTVDASHSVVGVGSQPFQYDTIGDFYKGIENCIKANYKAKSKYKNRPQLISKKGYYGQNNINTVYYDNKHKPQFPNADDSGNLVDVVDRVSAIHALKEVVEQGEGKKSKHKIGNHLTSDGKVKPSFCAAVNRGDFNPLDYDDKGKKKIELSHFDRFLELYCNDQKLDKIFKKRTDNPSFDYKKYFVHKAPNNPKQKDYYDPNRDPSSNPNAKVFAVSNLTNAMYTYLFLMTEACYYNAGNTQFEIFMFGIHKSMIWVLGSLCGDMMKLKYTTMEGKKAVQYPAGPTFEDYTFSKSTSPKQQILKLAQKSVDAGGKSYIDLINVLPDVKLNHQVGATL
jgi:hypothetical protein